MSSQENDTILVGVRFKNQFSWYRTDPSIWKLDYRKLYDSYDALYRRRRKSMADFVREVGSFGEFIASRFRIPVVDKDTAPKFFEEIMLQKLDSAELAYSWTRAKEDAERQALLPVLFVDFDAKTLYSCDPERGKFEAFVPDGWRGLYQDFKRLIPLQDRFWQ